MNNNDSLIENLSSIFELSEQRVMEMIVGPKLTVAEAAEMLGVQREEVYGMITKGEIMAFRLRSHYRIPQKALIDLIARKMVAASLE